MLFALNLSYDCGNFGSWALLAHKLKAHYKIYSARKWIVFEI